MIRPLIVGRGTAGRALAPARSTLSGEGAPAAWLERGAAPPAPRDPPRAPARVEHAEAVRRPLAAAARER